MDPEEEQEEQKSEQTFTQADVNRIMSREKKEGKAAGERAILEALGVSSTDELKELIQSAKAAEEAQMGEVEKAKAAAEAEKAAAAKEREAAKRDRHEAAVERAVLKAGVDPDDKTFPKIIKLIEVEEGASSEEITEAVSTLKEEMPALFTPVTQEAPPEEENQEPPKPKIPGSEIPAAPRFPGTASPKESALARLHERHPQTSS